MSRHARLSPVVAAVVVGFVLRAAFGLVYWVDKPLTHDEREYLSLARSLASGRGFTYDAEGLELDKEQFGRPPGYPFFLALVGGGRRLPAAIPWTVKVAQSLVGAAGVWLIAAIARRLGGEPTAIVAAWIAAVYPPLVWIAGYALSECLYSTLALAAVVLIDAALDRSAGMSPGSVGWVSLLAGLVSGLAALTRPVMLFFLPIAGLWLVVRREWRMLFLVVLGVLMVVTPWTIRNARVYHRFVLIASEGGVTFWTGNHPLSRGEGDLAANPELKREYQAIKARHPGLSATELEPVFYQEAGRTIREHPASWLGLLVRKLFYLWVPVGPSYRLHSALYYSASLVSYGLLLPFAVAGMLRLRRVGHRPEGLWLLAASTVLASLAFFPQERFRIPVIDPFLIVCAAVWVAGRRS